MDESERIIMNVGILRLNVGDFGKIGSYNVQEIGLAAELIKLGYNVDVFYLYKDVEKIEDDTVYSNVHYVPRKTFKMHGIFQVEHLKSYELDALIVFSDNQLWTGKVIEWCEIKRIPCICYWGAVLSTTKKPLNQIYTWLIYLKNYRWYQKSINVSKTRKVHQELNKYKIPSHGIINVGLDKSILKSSHNNKTELRKKHNIVETAKILLYIGRLVENKNPLFALEILQSLLEESKNYFLILIGDGVLADSVKKYIKSDDLYSNIIWLKKVPYSEMYQYYQISDCLINLCPAEIFGMAMLESMYYKCPVVAMNAAGPSEYIIDNSTGYICNNLEVSEWKPKIKKAMDRDLQVIENGFNKIINNYFWDKNAKKFDDLIKNYYLTQ
jgi:1,2-diacylglycerol 3-alpha-glucosyltransferase